MDRRHFILDLSLLCAGALTSGLRPAGRGRELVFGHHDKKYTWDEKWPELQASRPFLKDCHEMVFTHGKDLIMLTNDTRNNLIAFDKKGQVKSAGCHEFPGGHGLTLGGEPGDEFLLITDTDRHQFFKTTLDGKIIQSWDYPADTGKYASPASFIPTETAAAPDGSIYVADGYGAQYITHYDKDGHLKNIFGGRGEGDEHLDNAHGICIDYRQEAPTLIVTDRNRCCFKRYTLAGEYLEKISIPGANVCRPVIKGNYLYAAVLTSDNTGNANTGFVIILDKKNQLVSAIAGATPKYVDGICQNMYQAIQLFRHPHDVVVDDEDNLYVCQWNSGQVMPYKFAPYA